MAKTIGERLKWARTIKKLTQEDVAKVIGVKPQTISGYEKNYRQPDNDILKNLADIYEVTTDFLLGRTNNPNQPGKDKEKDMDYTYQAKTLADALQRIAELDFRLDFDDETMIQLVRKAREKYGLPGGKGVGIAAHGPNYPGSGALDDKK